MANAHTDNVGWIRFLGAAALWYGAVGAALRRAAVTLPFFRFETAVDAAYIVLFALSGYLVAGAIGGKTGLPGFALRRILRIYAPLLMMIAVTLLLIGPLASPWGLYDYFTATSWAQDARASLLFPLHVTLDEDGNPAFEAVNRALGPLRLLLELDALLIVLAALDILRPRLLGFVTLIVCAARVFGVVADLLLPFLHIPLEVPAPALAFLTGAWLASARNASLLAPGPALGALAVLALAHFIPGIGGNLLFTLATAYIAVYLATLPLPFASRLQPLGALSYGFYLYLFPCTALAAHWSRNFAVAATLSLALSLACAWASRRWIERRTRP